MTIPDLFLLSPHLTLAEAIRSDTAARLGLDNTPPAEAISRLRKVALTLFEPIRTQFGPLRVTSGYRCEPLNSKTPGSSRTSAHIYGCALDIEPLSGSVRLRDIMTWLEYSKLPYDQIIYEFGSWIHIAIERPSAKLPSRQTLMKFAGTMYLPFDEKDKRVIA